MDRQWRGRIALVIVIVCGLLALAYRMRFGDPADHPRADHGDEGTPPHR